jgi:hypothetical protein
MLCDVIGAEAGFMVRVLLGFAMLQESKLSHACNPIAITPLGSSFVDNCHRLSCRNT